MAQDDNNRNDQGNGGGDNSDGRGRVTDPETDQRVDNKSGNMGRTFAENPELASAAGRKGGEHRRAGEDTGHEDELNENIRRAQEGGGHNDDGDEDNRGSRGGGNRNARRGPISQKEAVYNAITNVLGTNEFDGPVKLSPDERQEVRRQIVDQFKNGEVSFGGDLPNDRELLTYCSGLISNWLRKDGRLNGHTKYQPKNPGSRAGAGDEMLRAMKQLLDATQDPDARRDIQKSIDERKEQIAAKNRPNINVDVLPDHLKKYAQQQ